MALVKKIVRTAYENHRFETESRKNGKPLFRATCEFVDGKPKYLYNDGPNAFVQLCVSNRASTQDWYLNIEELQDIARACEEAIAQLRPFSGPQLEEVK